MSQAGIQSEWSQLQAEYDSYEKQGLLIKLLAITVVALALIVGATSLALPVVLLIVWLQDAIWKTFQARIEKRLLKLESALANKSTDVAPYQYNNDFQASRASGGGLIAEYLSQALRPTVAYPHVALLLVWLIYRIF